MASLWIGIDLASQPDIAFEFDHVPLQSWGLSSRTLNALLRHNFKMNVGDVLRADQSFATIRGLGTAGITELQAKVTQLVTEAHRNKKSPFSTAQLSSNISLKSLSGLHYETAQKLSLDQLHLDTTTHKVLIKAGITTIGELCSASNSRLRDIEGFSPDSLGRVNSSIITLLNSLNQTGEINWFQYWKAQEIDILPSGYASDVSFEQIIRELTKIIEEVLNREFDERAGIIIGSRLGLGFEAKLKLEEIGNAFGGISRERVRQIEERALTVLREVFVEQYYRGRNYHVHPYIHLLIQTIRNFIEAAPYRLILETKLQESLCQRFNIDANKVKVPLNLIFSLLDVQHMEFDYPNAVAAWGYVEPDQRRSLEKWIKRLDDLLTRETPLPLSEVKILVHLNKKVKKSEVLLSSQLKWLIDLCNTVERCEDGSIWGKFEYLKGRGNQVERLLTLADRPLSVAEITREINHRLVPLGQRQLTDANLTNQIINDGRFVPIGRSGQWGLKSWTHIDTNSILKLMEHYLIIQNKPATVDDIYLYVSERRPVSKNSIILYLSTEKEHFVKVGLTTWGLAKWSDTTSSDTWNTERIADFVATIFKQKKVNELDYRIIKEALMKEAGINAFQAQGLLNHNPAIKTRKGIKSGERVAMFQSNYKNTLAQAKYSKRSRRINQGQYIEESVHSILDGVPDKQLPLADLIRLLQKQFDLSELSLYGYINRMNSIELIGIPNSRRKICRVKGAMDSTGFGTLRDRVNKSVRAILEAMPNKQIPLDDLIKRLQKEYHRPKATFYHYIADLDYVERLDIPNSHAKMCRMKDTQRAELFPQVQNITDTLLREKVERVLPFITEENVDIGLFLLSKEFEVTLKTYLINASMKGKLSVLPQGKTPDRWNLIGMVECARDNGIISDHATFHYLRQARNERAHGTMPSLAERQLLMKSIQYIAGLYIDYIKLLDDLTQNL